MWQNGEQLELSGKGFVNEAETAVKVSASLLLQLEEISSLEYFCTS